jgi:hypothetical protein
MFHQFVILCIELIYLARHGRYVDSPLLSRIEGITQKSQGKNTKTKYVRRDKLKLNDS